MDHARQHRRKPGNPGIPLSFPPVVAVSRGSFDVPVSVDQHVGAHGTQVQIITGDDAVSLLARVIRTANTNGTPRIMGGTALRDYFRTHCRVGDSILVTILSAERLRLTLPQPDRG